MPNAKAKGYLTNIAICQKIYEPTSTGILIIYPFSFALYICGWGNTPILLNWDQARSPLTFKPYYIMLQRDY